MNFEKYLQSDNCDLEGEDGLEKNRIEMLQRSEIEIGSKLDLALLILKRKEAAFLGNADIIESEEHKEKLERKFQEEFCNIEEVLKETKLLYRATPPHDDQGVYCFSFLVSGSENGLEKAIEAQKNKDDRSLGLLLGYPETAVDAYMTDKKFDYHKELPKDELGKLEKEGVLPFLEFMPSREHWKDELSWAKENQNLIKEKAPSLYEETAMDNSKGEEQE
ncbi:MAG: hypothetical protein WC926_04435 [Candidatus Paceibacterota bacterium]|jgi:hypothetical protein